MPDLDLEPKHYRSNRPRIVSRRQAKVLLVIALALAIFMGWPTETGNRWLGMFGPWIPLIAAGALITRLWPLFLLGED